MAKVEILPLAFWAFVQISLIVVLPIILDFALETFGIEVWKRSLITLLTRFRLFIMMVTKLDFDAISTAHFCNHSNEKHVTAQKKI